MNVAGDSAESTQRHQQEFCYEDEQKQQLQTYLTVLLKDLEDCKDKINELTAALNNSRDEVSYLKSALACASSNEQGIEDNAPRKIARKNSAAINLTSIDDANFNDRASSSMEISNESTNTAMVDGASHRNQNNGASLSFTQHSKLAQQKNNNNFSNSKHNIISSVKGKKKIIQVLGTDMQVLKSKIKAANCSDFSLKQSSVNAPIIISINNSDEINKVRDTLSSNSVSFHEYKLNSEKSKCFLIRGLSGSSSDDIPVIKQDLIDAGLPQNISVVPLVTGYMRANPKLRHNALFKLILPPEVDTNILAGIKFIDHVAVSFENFKSNSIIQCKNCQRFGHSAGGCNHEHRCVKCGSNHFRNECPRTINRSIMLKCCNCGGEHTANNLTMCKYFLQQFGNNNITKAATNQKAVRPSAGNFQSKASSSVKNNSSKPSYSQIVKGHNQDKSSASILADLSRKMDLVMQLVSGHDNLIKQILNG